MPPAFYYKDNRLYCEQTDLQRFAEEHATPFYLYSTKEITANCRLVQTIGKPYDFLPCFALKANYNPTLLKLIRDLGFGADVVSGGELQAALKLGFAPEKIVFAGVGKTAEELELAIRTGIFSINIESLPEFHMAAALAEKRGKKTRIAIRINPDIDAHTHSYISTGKHINKFGVTPEVALQLFELAGQNPWLEADGLHLHIGSQITDAEPFRQAVQFVHNFLARLRQKGIHVNHLDLGGGIGVNYHNNFHNDEPTTYLQDILPRYLEGFKKLKIKLVVELGRSIIAAAGLLIIKAIYNKESAGKNFLIVDAAMNNLLRPSLYQAHHEIVPLTLDKRPQVIYDVVGPVCESGDFLAKDRPLMRIDAGEFIAVAAAGAYGQSLSSNYNLRPRIAEYLVNGETVQTIFKRQTIDDIMNAYEL